MVSVYDGLAYSATQTVFINVLDTTTLIIDAAAQPADWQITVGPNPVQNTLYISGKISTQQAQIILTDAAGRTIQTKNQRVINQTLNTQIQMETITSGLYFLRITADNGTEHTFKVLKL